MSAAPADAGGLEAPPRLIEAAAGGARRRVGAVDQHDKAPSGNCSTSTSGTSDVSASRGRGPLKRMAARTYKDFVWSLSFGLVIVVSAPLLVAAMLSLGAWKTLRDRWLTAFGGPRPYGGW